MAKLATFTNKIDKDVRDKFRNFCDEKGYKIHKLLERAMLDEMRIVELKEDSFNFESAFDNFEEKLKSAKGFSEVTGKKIPSKPRIMAKK